MKRAGMLKLLSNACALFMLCILPLIFRNAYFDINRFKVAAVCTVVPILTIFVLIFTDWQRIRLLRKQWHAASISLLVFLAAGCISYMMSGLNPNVLSGSDGRYCGLFFLLACGCAFACIRRGEIATGALPDLAVFCAVLVSLLGILNTAGIDPLGFYARIQKGQEHFFLSTIGNIDFFGVYLSMLLPIAMGQSIFSWGKRSRIFAFAESLVMIAGIAISRTDVSYAAMHLSALVLLILAADSWERISRALCLWSTCWLVLPAVRPILLFSRFGLDFSGVTLILCEMHIAWGIGLVMLLLAALARRAGNKRISTPGRKQMMRLFSIIGLIAAAALICAMVFCTAFLAESDAQGIASYFRIDDHWGSRRGFVYLRGIRAFRDYSTTERLFGRGVDLTKQILTPYFDNPDMLKSGVFNDAHNQPLQFLLTCGLMGMASFLAFFVSMLREVAKHAGDDPFLCGVFAFLCSYGFMMLLSVTQPILIAVYVSLCALALSHIHTVSLKEVRHES